MSAFGFCQPTLIQINSTLCSAVIACYFPLPSAAVFFMDFKLCLAAVCASVMFAVSHANPTSTVKLRVLLRVCVNVSCASFLSACMYFFGNASGLFFCLFFWKRSKLEKNVKMVVTAKMFVVVMFCDKQTLECSVSTNSRFSFCLLNTPTPLIVLILQTGALSNERLTVCLERLVNCVPRRKSVVDACNPLPSLLPVWTRQLQMYHHPNTDNP